MSEEKSDAELVKRIQAGDRQAEEELIQRFSRRVPTMLKRLIHDPSAVEDLSQETFRIMLESIRAGKVREPDKLAGFIHRLANNLAIGYFRRTARENHADIEAIANRPDPAPSPLEEVLQKEKDTAALRVLDELKSRDREVLSRFYLAEEDKEQICADLKLTNNQFNLILWRAKQRFKELYEKRAGRQFHKIK